MHVRRVVVGFADDGSTLVQADGAAPAAVELPPEVGASLVDIWRSDTVPLTAGGTDDPTAAPFALMPAGCLFRIIDLAPGEHAPMWHQTASVDFNYVASGSIVLLTGDEDAPIRTDLHAGDTAVVRGVRHAWRNDGTETCRLVCSSVAAVLPDGSSPS